MAARCRDLWAAVVLEAVDEAIEADRIKGRDGIAEFRRWAGSRDGRLVIGCAGIEPGPRATERLAALVARGVKTNAALAKTQAAA